ncbi:MAG: hypothetical protein CMI27_03935 [Opitutae bacterium]|nr:hypothetical protein [Opitutae bacterium]
MTARATSDSFLLKYFEPADISLMIMGAASLSIVLALLSTYLCSKYQAFGAMQIATASLVFALVIIVASLFVTKGMGVEKGIFIFAYMICEVIVILPMVLFWGMAVGILNPSESKKWFGLIGAAGTCGCILAGYTVSLASKSDIVNELSLGLVTILLITANIILILKGDKLKIPVHLSSGKAVQNTTIVQKFKVLFSGRQSVLMTMLVVFSAMALSVIDINFKFEVRKDQEDLYDFFGLFYTYTSVTQLILQLLIVRAILTRGGVMAAISILPSLLILTSIGAIFFGTQDAIYVGKFITQVVFFTIEYVGLQMLFLAVSKQLRGQMNSAVDGLTRPATIATISLLITYSLPFWQSGSESEIVWKLNLVVIFLCGCWLLISRLNYKEYLASLSRMLGSKKIDFEDEAQPELDPKFIEDLKVSFRRSNPEDALFLSEFVIQMNLEGWNEDFRRKVDSGNLALRKNALSYLAKFEERENIVSLIETVLSDSEDVQIAFIDSLNQSERSEYFDLVQKFVESKYRQVRCNSATTLMNSEDLKVREKGERIFNEFLFSTEEEQKIISLHALPRLKNLDTSMILSKFLTDEKSMLHKLALESINRLNFESLFPRLINMVRENSHKPLIFRKAEQCGKIVEEILDQKIRESVTNEKLDELCLLIEFRFEATLVKRSDEIEVWLESLGEHPQRDILELLYVRKISISSKQKELRNWARANLSEVLVRARQIAFLLSSVPDQSKFDMLSFILSSRQREKTALLIEIIGILDRSIDFKKLFEVAREKGTDAKSEVEEVLKGALNPKLAEEVMYATLTKRGSGKAMEFENLFEQLSSKTSKWYKCSLLLAMYSKNYESHSAYVDSALRDSDPMVRECALHVLIENEKNKEKLKENCLQMKSDESLGIADMALNQLQIAS